MTNNQTQKSALLLAIAGLASALFTIATQRLVNRAFGFYEGFAFGAWIAAYFLALEGVRSVTKVVAFVAASTAAYLIALQVAFKAIDFFPSHGFMGPSGLDIPLPVFFMSGAVGAFMILAAAFLLFGPSDATWRSVGRLALWSGVGGLLAIVGWASGSMLALLVESVHFKVKDAPFVSLSIVWETGVALSLALMLSRERAKVAAGPSHAPGLRHGGQALWRRLATILFFSGVFAFLGWEVFTTAQVEKASARRMDAYQKFLAEAPSVQNLPSIPAMLPEQALILGDLGGLFAETPFIRAFGGRAGSSGKFAPVPPTRVYSLSYVPRKDVPDGTYQFRIAAEVVQYPNADWARYKAKYTATFNPALNDPKYLATVTKYENRIVMDTSMRYPDGGGALLFVWPSDNVVVTIRYETKNVNEEFLKRYLERYPSSLGH